MKKSKRIEKLESKIRLLESANTQLNKDVRNLIDGKNVFTTSMKYKAIDAMYDGISQSVWSGVPTHTIEFGKTY